MEDWTNLCRCCLSPQSEISLFDTASDNSEKFFEITSIQIKDDDGLPQMLCTDCYTILESALQFRRQCRKIDTELKSQLDALLSVTENTDILIDDSVSTNNKKNEEFVKMTEDDDSECILQATNSDSQVQTDSDKPANDQDTVSKISPKIAHLEPNTNSDNDDVSKCINNMQDIENNLDFNAIVKVEPDELDDDQYYVLVVDDKGEEIPPDIKQEFEESKRLTKIKSEINHSPENNLDLQHFGKPPEFKIFGLNNDKRLFNKSTEKITGLITKPLLQPNSPSGIGKKQEKNNMQSMLLMKNNLIPSLVSKPINFEKSVESFLLKIPVASENIPDEQFDSEMDVHDPDTNFLVQNSHEFSDSNSQDIPTLNIDSSQLITTDDPNIIKILTADGKTENFFLKSYGKDNVISTYITSDDFIDDGSQGLNQDEVIVCEGNDSQLQIVNYGSELVIEYADEGQIATVIQQEDGTYLCECGEIINDLTDYEHHQISHQQTGLENICHLCGKGFLSRQILTGHMLLHQEQGMHIQCPFCEVILKRNSLTQHIKISHNNIKPTCKICFKTFANDNNLKRHMTTHSEYKPFECDVCLKRFHQKITMQTHRMLHNKEGYVCGSNFLSEQELIEYKRENIECNELSFNSHSKYAAFKEYLTTEDGEPLGYSCKLCQKHFSVESSLESHIDSVHLKETSDSLCSECGEVLPDRKSMQLHVANHKGLKAIKEKRFVCEVCNKICPSHAMLVMHQRVHTNERPYACHLCSFKFKTKTHLRTHQLTHTREKKFGCSVCLKFFALKGNLVVHLRTHTGERPYACSLCGEAFIDTKYLRKHKAKKHSIFNVPWNQY